MLLRDLFEKSAKLDQTVWVILYTSDKLVLGKRSPSAKNPNQWNFFGGHVDKGESETAAAVRELEEETGLKISAASLKQVTKIGNATYFVAKIAAPSEVNSSGEISKIKSFKLVDLPDNLHSKTQNFFDQLDALFK